MNGDRTSVGLDVRARSVVACGMDGWPGELFERQLSPDHGDVAAWVRSLPAPVARTYQVGPTGFGLARFLARLGIECAVVAPWKLQRPSGGRVKTDVCDARHLARLLRLLLGVVVAMAGSQKCDGAHRLLAGLRARCSTHVRADGGYAGRLVHWTAQLLGLVVQVVRHTDDQAGSRVLPRRWVVERTSAWTSKHRRCVRDYETQPEPDETMVHITMITTMSRRLSRP